MQGFLCLRSQPPVFLLCCGRMSWILLLDAGLGRGMAHQSSGSTSWGDAQRAWKKPPSCLMPPQSCLKASPHSKNLELGKECEARQAFSLCCSGSLCTLSKEFGLGLKISLKQLFDRNLAWLHPPSCLWKADWLLLEKPLTNSRSYKFGFWKWCFWMALISFVFLGLDDASQGCS